MTFEVRIAPPKRENFLRGMGGTPFEVRAHALKMAAAGDSATRRMFREGSPVRIVKGDYAGNNGEVIKVTAVSVRVSSPTLENEVTIRQTSVELLDSITDSLGGLSLAVSSAANATATPTPRR
jgi:hypothetical protein